MSSEHTDRKWFEELYRTFAKEIYWVSLAYACNKELARDAVQETFLYVWKNRATIVDRTDLRAYLILIAKNYITDCFRHRQVKEDYVNKVISGSLDEPPADSDEDREEMLARAKRLIDSLPAECRKIFLMAVMDGMSYQQIAEKQGISVNTVKTQMKIAYRKVSCAPLLFAGIYWEMLK